MRCRAMPAPDVVREARAWIGTPFAWQQAVKGRGCDCKGLVAGVARELGRAEAASLYAGMGQYRVVDPRLLREGLAALFDRANAIAAGDVLLMIVAGKAQHLGIATGKDSVIHCYARGPRRVIEQPLRSVTAMWPIDSIWRWRA